MEVENGEVFKAALAIDLSYAQLCQGTSTTWSWQRDMYARNNGISVALHPWIGHIITLSPYMV